MTGDRMGTTTADDGAAELTLPDGRQVLCPRPHSAAVLWREINDGWYGAACTDLPNGAIIDVGANIGMAAMFFADRYPDCRIVAIEPAVECYRCLVENLTRYVPNGEPLELAAGVDDGAQPFVYYPNSPEQSTLRPDSDDQQRTGDIVLANSGVRPRARRSMVQAMFVPRSRTVRVRPLGSILDDQNVDAVSLLKVDVEGGELDVLSGLRDDQWPRIARAVVEVHDRCGQLAQTKSMLERAGYRVRVHQARMLAGSSVYAVFADRR